MTRRVLLAALPFVGTLSLKKPPKGTLKALVTHGGQQGFRYYQEAYERALRKYLREHRPSLAFNPIGPSINKVVDDARNNL